MATVKRRKFRHLSCSYKITLAGMAWTVKASSVQLWHGRYVPFRRGWFCRGELRFVMAGEACTVGAWRFEARCVKFGLGKVRQARCDAVCSGEPRRVMLRLGTAWTRT